MYAKLQSLSNDSSCGNTCRYRGKPIHCNGQCVYASGGEWVPEKDIKQRIMDGFRTTFFDGIASGLDTKDHLQYGGERTTVAQPQVIPTVETGICIDTKYAKTDISPIISELAKLYEEMTQVTAKLHAITSEPTYSFYEEDFYIVVKRWKEMTDKREELLKQIVGRNEIGDMTQYIANLCQLSKFNKERNELVDKLTTLISIPLNNTIMSLQEELDAHKNEIEALGFANSKLNKTITEASIHATNYSRIKEDEFDALRAEYIKLKEDYLVLKNHVNDTRCTYQCDYDVRRVINEPQSCTPTFMKRVFQPESSTQDSVSELNQLLELFQHGYTVSVEKESEPTPCKQDEKPTESTDCESTDCCTSTQVHDNKIWVKPLKNLKQIEEAQEREREETLKEVRRKLQEEEENERKKLTESDPFTQFKVRAHQGTLTDTEKLSESDPFTRDQICEREGTESEIRGMEQSPHTHYKING